MLKITYLVLFIFFITNHINFASDDIIGDVNSHGHNIRSNAVDPIIINDKHDYKNLLVRVQNKYALLGLRLAEMRNIAECMNNNNHQTPIHKIHKELYMTRYDAVSNLINEFYHNNTLILDPNRSTMRYPCRNNDKFYEIQPVRYDIKSLLKLPENNNYASLITTIAELQHCLTKSLEDARSQKKSLNKTHSAH